MKSFSPPGGAIERGRMRGCPGRPDFEATTKGVHRAPVSRSCNGDSGRLSPVHDRDTGAKEQRAWGSNPRSNLSHGGTPQHSGLGNDPDTLEFGRLMIPDGQANCNSGNAARMISA